VIVVIGSPTGQLRDNEIVAGGTPARVALAAAAAGREVQLLGRTGDDPAADGLLLGLTQGGVGHAALLRDPARPTPLEKISVPDDGTASIDDEPPAPAVSGDPSTRPAIEAADVDLGLRYLADFAVLVVAEPAGDDVIRVAAEASRWNAARLLLVVDAGSELPGALPGDAIVFEAPDDDRDGLFASFVGTFAAALDDGADPADAFRSSIAAEGWTEAAAE